MEKIECIGAKGSYEIRVIGAMQIRRQVWVILEYAQSSCCLVRIGVISSHVDGSVPRHEDDVIP